MSWPFAFQVLALLIFAAGVFLSGCYHGNEKQLERLSEPGRKAADIRAIYPHTVSAEYLLHNAWLDEWAPLAKSLGSGEYELTLEFRRKP